MCYDTWKTTHPDEYDYDPYEDYVHIDELEKYDEAKGFLEEILRHIYTTGDIELLEDQLEELCAVFDLKIPKSAPKLQKKRSELFDFAVQLSQKHAKNLTYFEEVL